MVQFNARGDDSIVITGAFAAQAGPLPQHEERLLPLRFALLPGRCLQATPDVAAFWVFMQSDQNCDAAAPLGSEWRNHPLKGDFDDHREYHLGGGFLLIDRLAGRCILLARGGHTHSELFDCQRLLALTRLSDRVQNILCCCRGCHARHVERRLSLAAL